MTSFNNNYLLSHEHENLHKPLSWHHKHQFSPYVLGQQYADNKMNEGISKNSSYAYQKTDTHQLYPFQVYEKNLSNDVKSNFISYPYYNFESSFSKTSIQKPFNTFLCSSQYLPTQYPMDQLLTNVNSSYKCSYYNETFNPFAIFDTIGRDKTTVQLKNNVLWNKFHQVGNEMVITKTGR